MREYARNIHQYLGELEHSEGRNLAELIAWNKKHADIEPLFGTYSTFYKRYILCHETDHANQERLIQAYNFRPSEERYEEAIQHLRKVVIETGLDPLFEEKGLDLIAVPQDSKIPSMATASGKSS